MKEKRKKILKTWNVKVNNKKIFEKRSFPPHNFVPLDLLFVDLAGLGVLVPGSQELLWGSQCQLLPSLALAARQSPKQCCRQGLWSPKAALPGASHLECPALPLPPKLCSAGVLWTWLACFKQTHIGVCAHACRRRSRCFLFLSFPGLCWLNSLGS